MTWDSDSTLLTRAPREGQGPSNMNRALGLSWVGIPRAGIPNAAYWPSGLVGMSVPLVYQPMTNLLKHSRPMSQSC